MKLLKNRPFAATVKVQFPGLQPDETIEASFTGQFVALTASELKGIKVFTPQDQIALLDRVFTGWSDFIDDTDGGEQALAVTPENRALLLDDIFIRNAVIQTYYSAMAGAKRGN